MGFLDFLADKAKNQSQRIIDKYNKEIPKAEEFLKHVPEGRRKDMLRDRIRKMKLHREKAIRDLQDSEKRDSRSESQ